MSYHGEYPSWYDTADDISEQQLSERRIKSARKQHRCSSCLKPIQVGSGYIREFWLVDGEPHTVTRHGGCLHY